MYIATMTTKGQMTLPSKVRKAMGLGPGDKVEVTVSDDGSATMRKRSRSLADIRGIISIEGSANEIDNWIKEARDAMASGNRE